MTRFMSLRYCDVLRKNWERRVASERGVVNLRSEKDGEDREDIVIATWKQFTCICIYVFVRAHIGQCHCHLETVHIHPKSTIQIMKKLNLNQ